MGMMSGGTATRSRAYSFAVYVVIFVLGVAQGVIGSFQYGQPPVPLIAILLDVTIFATCVLCGWGTMTFSGALEELCDTWHGRLSVHETAGTHPTLATAGTGPLWPRARIDRPKGR